MSERRPYLDLARQRWVREAIESPEGVPGIRWTPVAEGPDPRLAAAMGLEPVEGGYEIRRPARLVLVFRCGYPLGRGPCRREMGYVFRTREGLLALPFVLHPDPMIVEGKPILSNGKAKDDLEAVPRFLDSPRDVVELRCPGRAHGGPYTVDVPTIRAEAARTTNRRKPRYLHVPLEGSPREVSAGKYERERSA